jgi:hypothetical protein
MNEKQLEVKVAGAIFSAKQQQLVIDKEISQLREIAAHLTPAAMEASTAVMGNAKRDILEAMQTVDPPLTRLEWIALFMYFIDVLERVDGFGKKQHPSNK